MDIQKLEEASDAYYNGSPIMTDEEFDAAIIALRSKDPKKSVFKKDRCSSTRNK